MVSNESLNFGLRHKENVDISSNVNIQKTMETCADCVYSPIHISKNHIKHCIVETRQAI